MARRGRITTKARARATTGRSRVARAATPATGGATRAADDSTTSSARRPDTVIVSALTGNSWVAARVAESRAGARRRSDVAIPVQRFGSKEHQNLGNTPTGGAEYDVRGGGDLPGADPGPLPDYNNSFRLTHGDIVALSGDYFDPRDHLRQSGRQVANPDSLFRLAALPSPRPGQATGTRDEIVYCLHEINANDPRFQPGGKWHGITFSEAVGAAATERYLRLAANNIEHFVSPTGTGSDAEGAMGSSAHASYRQLHTDALRRGFEAGQNGQPIDMAMAREAAAHHFLTDAFAAGHLRTPRVSIREHWSAIYPSFWNNLKKKIAHDMARYINANQTNVATLWGNVMDIYNGILPKIEEKTQAVPPFSFDNLVALIAHDLDNEVGVMVTNDFGTSWRTYGDSHLSEEQGPLLESPTEQPAHAAVAAGVADVQAAFDMGRVAPGFLDDGSIFAGVKGRTGASPTNPEKFEPEKYLPRIDESQETSQQSWALASVDELWDAPVRSDLPDRTYGVELTESLKNGELHHQLSGMALDMEPESVGPWGLGGTLDIQAAYLNGFLGPLVAQPLVGLRAVIDFDPSVGQAGHNTDDAAREDIEAMGADDLAGLTLNQRADRIKALVEGTLNYVSESDGELVISLFETAKSGDRSQLYRLVEGHAWTGDWKRGVFVSDDEIWNALTRAQLRRLRDIINGT